MHPVGKEIKREDVKRFEIDRDLKLIDGGGRIIFRCPVREAHEYSTSWCKKCREFVPEADISIGAGPQKGTCIAYLQTESGLDIFERACVDGRLVVSEVPAKFKERFEKTRLQKMGLAIEKSRAQTPVFRP